MRDIVTLTVSLWLPLTQCIPFAKNLLQTKISRKMYLPSWDIPEANLRWYIWMLIQGSQEKKRETWDIVYIIIRRLYITLLRGRLLFLFFVNGQLLWYFNINVFLLRDVSEYYILTLNWTKPAAATFLYKFDLCKFVTFFHWWSRNFLFCKGESGVPRFFISYSVNIRAELCPSIHFG